MKYALFTVTLLFTTASAGQPIADSLLVWEGYFSQGQTQVSIYPNPADTSRPYTLVLRELATNKGPSTVDDLAYLAEEAGRSFQLDPSKVNWILHWGAFSFEGAAKTRKEIFLRATFKRTKNRHLGRPQWRLVTREEVELLTDRAFY
ncbi:MAG: hypothetical protein AAF564_19805 [Bacteroidota bacterium]